MLSKSIIEQAAQEALKLGAESPGIEFKSTAPFKKLRYAIARAAQGLSNTRDGGFIIIGVKQRKGIPPELQGVTDSIKEEYDPEVVRDTVNKYASPPIETQTVVVEHDGKTYITIAIPPFTRTPTVCRLATPQGVDKEDEMRPGDVFIRPQDKIETRRVHSGAEMDELLQIALGRRVSEIFGALPDALQSFLTHPGQPAAPTSPPASSVYNAEVSDLDDYL